MTTPRHAYLILAHGEFRLLELLVARLDDPRNDIYIHIDAKVEHLPSLVTKYAGLTFVAERYDVRWADVSVLRAEFALFRTAKESGDYAYYHLLSGVDLPIKPQSYIHDFFQREAGREFIGFYRGADKAQDICRKVQRRHLFARDFRGEGVVWLAKRVVRALYIRLQEALKMERYPERKFDKGTQWLSITEALVQELLRAEREILSLYQDTFCSDEIAIHSFVASSPFMARVYAPTNEARSALRHIGWHEGELRDFDAKDYEDLKQSDALFARKFNSRDMDFIDKVLGLSEERSSESRE